MPNNDYSSKEGHLSEDAHVRLTLRGRSRVDAQPKFDDAGVRVNLKNY